MKRLVIRADDLGYSEAVNYGIEKSVKCGLIRSVGLMTNMDAVVHGLSLIQDCDIALGQHTNISCGRPAAGADAVPSLVDESTREFRSSGVYRDAAKRGEDFVAFDDAYREIRAQLDRFRELVGRDPDYFECHAVFSPCFFDALRQVAGEDGLKLAVGNNITDSDFTVGTTLIKMLPPSDMRQAYDACQALRDAVGIMCDGDTGIYVCHPGYIDSYLLHHSGLTIPRTQEVEMLVDPSQRKWLADNGIELIDYRDL